MTADTRLFRWMDRDRDDYARLVAALDGVRRSAAYKRGEIVVPVFSGPEEPSDLDRVRALFAQRRARDAAAGHDGDLFADPAWDLLLILFIARADDHPLTEAEACAATCVAPAAAMRWLGALVDRGLAVRKNHATGTIAALTDHGSALVLRCVSDA